RGIQRDVRAPSSPWRVSPLGRRLPAERRAEAARGVRGVELVRRPWSKHSLIRLEARAGRTARGGTGPRRPASRSRLLGGSGDDRQSKSGSALPNHLRVSVSGLLACLVAHADLEKAK